jgi:hypothetical protein
MAKFNGIPFHEVKNVSDKQCAVCEKTFTPKSGVHKFCSEVCKGKWKYITGEASTENQYKEISGDWKRYISRLMYYGGRKRDQLNRDIILKKLKEQNYKCALSGADLTCNLEKGIRFPTNVSVDRIIPGGPYTEDNIQLVCRALNSWRADLPVDEFTAWCRKVVEHQTKGKRGTDG